VNNKNNETILIANANNEFDCQAICDLLEDNGIPTLKKYRGADGYLTLYMGGHNDSIEIHVPKAAYERALLLVKEFNYNKAEMSFDDIMNWNKKRRFRVRALLVVFVVLPIIVTIIIRVIGLGTPV
jgi:hypothetical protein